MASGRAARGTTTRRHGRTGGREHAGRAIEVRLRNEKIEKVNHEELAMARRKIGGLEVALGRRGDQHFVGDARQRRIWIAGDGDALATVSIWMVSSVRPVLEMPIATQS